MWTPGPWGWEWGEEGPQSAGGWDEEGTLELWSWEWGIPKCWGMGGVSKLWGEETMQLWGWEWGTLKCWGMG